MRVPVAGWEVRRLCSGDLGEGGRLGDGGSVLRNMEGGGLWSG